MSNQLERFDAWVEDTSGAAALTMRQYLVPVEGPDAVIFPPTYPIEDDRSGYNIDTLDSGDVCQIDSVGSQANRMEPIFKHEPYSSLVPQVWVHAEGRRISLLDAGHRAADAIVRFSTLGPLFHDAFRVWLKEGNAESLARIAPTSIVFGVWDSRATQAKLPRIVRSVIRAFKVQRLTRSAQYSTIAGEILGDGEADVQTKGPKAELGLAHVPAVRTHGGVVVHGDIRRDVVVNLTSLRTLAGTSRENTLALRRYILGLALVAVTAPTHTNLRQGCELVNDPQRPSQWNLVHHDGHRELLDISHQEILQYSETASEAFGVSNEPIVGEFSSKIANKVLSLKDTDRKKIMRMGPMTKEAQKLLGQ